MVVKVSFPGPPLLPTLPDWQAEWRKQAVLEEREACARLAEEHGAYATAAEIRARGGMTTTPVSNETRKAAPRQVEPLPDTGLGEKLADLAAQALRENPPPPDVLLPEGCSRWWPRVDVVDSEQGPCARLTWEARK